jgi:hypothetical protein
MIKKYEELDYSDNCSEIIKETRDVQLAPGLNTIFDCLIESIQLFQDNIVELVLQFKLQSYPDQLIDKYTFYSQQIHVIKDTYGAFYLSPWDDNTIEVFTHIYIEGQKKFVDQFKTKLGEAANDFYKNEPVFYNENIRKIASQLLLLYAQKSNDK